MKEVDERVDVPFLKLFDATQMITIDDWLASGIPSEFTFDLDSDTVDRYQTLEGVLVDDLNLLSTEAPYLPSSALPTSDWHPDSLTDIRTLDAFVGIEDEAVAPEIDAPETDPDQSDPQTSSKIH